MHVTRTPEGKTKVRLNIQVSYVELDPIKQAVVKELGKGVKVPGFRPGTAPLQVVEKNLDPQTLQTKFLDEALTSIYTRAVQQEKLQPVSKPEVTIKKFVPFSELEFEVATEVIGDIIVGNYKSIKVVKDEPKVSEKDVSDVLSSLQARAAEKKEVDRASKNGDEVVIDFSGFDSKNQPVKGAEGKDHPLLLGSKTFIPGFEDNLLGLKAGGEKDFTLTFPKDYDVGALAGKKIKFNVKAKKVQEVSKPKLDDKFASKVGPFKTLRDLKTDIKKQLKHEKTHEVNKRQQNEIVKKIIDKSEAMIPETLIEQQVNYNLDGLRRDLSYRGQTYQEFLAQEGKSEEEYKKEVVKPRSQEQVKTSLVLSEIARLENLTVTPEELEVRIQILKGQYKDEAMQAELDKPENRRDISSRLLTEKVLAKLQGYASSS